jgi:hypothetical protein
MDFIMNVAKIGGAFTLPESTCERRKEVLYQVADNETTMTNHITTRV